MNDYNVYRRRTGRRRSYSDPVSRARRRNVYDIRVCTYVRPYLLTNQYRLANLRTTRSRPSPHSSYRLCTVNVLTYALLFSLVYNLLNLLLSAPETRRSHCPDHFLRCSLVTLFPCVVLFRSLYYTRTAQNERAMPVEGTKISVFIAFRQMYDTRTQEMNQRSQRCLTVVS